MTDKPERLHLRRAKTDCITEERDRVGADRGADLAVHLGERIAYDPQHLGGRHPPAVNERGDDPPPLHLRCDLRPCSVNDNDIVPRRAQRQCLAGCDRRDPATELEDDPAHVVYSALMRT